MTWHNKIDIFEQPGNGNWPFLFLLSLVFLLALFETLTFEDTLFDLVPTLLTFEGFLDTLFLAFETAAFFEEIFDFSDVEVPSELLAALE